MIASRRVLKRLLHVRALVDAGTPHPFTVLEPEVSIHIEIFPYH
jgi:hypothetical protein